MTLDDLTEAATNYGAACAALNSAKECRAPSGIICAMQKNLDDARINLTDAATLHYQNTFDGGSQ